MTTVGEAVRERRFAAIVRTGLVLPRSPHPGRAWQPHTDAERHLLAQARELDGARRWLVEELARVRQVMRDLGITERPAPETQLPELELRVLAGAAAGEGLAETAARLNMTVATVKNYRRRIHQRLGARNITHAVALAADAGLISAEPVSGGES